MKGLAADDRPREKLLRLGATSLGDNELLAIVLGSGIRARNSLAVANSVLDAAGGLHGLLRSGWDDLRRVPGVGTARAAQVLAAVELGRRTLLRRPSEREPVKTPRDLAEMLLPQFGSKTVEHFGVVMLDKKHHVLRIRVLSVGTLDASLVHPREVFREATAASAASIVLFHNHPSGDPAPSRDDVLLTRRLATAGDIMGIPVVDHLVLGDGSYVSFRESLAHR
ncbi:MAG: DNA repair protein RadC [Acidobacteria bacterium]|nr:DNA repair protein RadC [Acidobacteriota bacterium]